MIDILQEFGSKFEPELFWAVAVLVALIFFARRSAGTGSRTTD